MQIWTCLSRREFGSGKKRNSFVNNENINVNNSDAPTCFSLSKKTSTFDPNNFEDNNDYFKPVSKENN